MIDTVPELITEAALRFPDRDAIRAAPAAIGYRALEAAITESAARIRSLSLAGRRVGLLLPNLPGFPATLYGALHAGASVLLLNPLYSRREVAEYLADAGVTTVVTVSALQGLIPEEIRSVLLDGHNASEDTGTTVPAKPMDGEAVVIYTSATGGWARGARLSHGNLAANARSTVEAMQLLPEDRVVAALPWSHAFGLTVSMNAPLSVGAAVIPVERFNPLRVLELFEGEQATVFCGVPAMYLALLAAAERRGAPRHRLRLAICGGAPLPVAVAHRWEEVFGLALREGYGITEAAPVCLFNRPDRPNRPGTMGFPFPGVRISVRSETGDAVPDGEVGELCVAGPNVFGGYVGEQGRSPRDFWGDYLRTGDLVSVEPDGAVRFRGFHKAMFTRSGFNIYPRELARVLEEDPRIARVEVRPVPDFAKENEVALVVHPPPGGTLAEDTVRQLCRERLAAYKQPGTITIQTSETS